MATQFFIGQAYAVDFEVPVYVVRCRHHFIFFKTIEGDPGILLVLSILHESMDLPRRLRDTLNQIEDGDS